MTAGDQLRNAHAGEVVEVPEGVGQVNGENEMTMESHESNAQRPASRLAAQWNLTLGWCPCGEELDGDCECFGTNRLAIAQGKAPVAVARTEEPR